MAGTRHHQVPQFLMRGFASRIIPKKKGDTVLVWLYRKNAAPREVSTVDIGVEDKFYQHGELNVDPEITDIEGRFAECLNELRHCGDGYRITDLTFLEFVVHLTSRTKHVRDSFVISGGFLVDGLFRYLADNWRDYFQRYFAKNRREIASRLENHTDKENASPYEKAIARRLVYSLTPKQMVRLIEQTNNYELVFPLLRDHLAARLNDLVKQAHIKALLDNLVSEPRIEHFQKFRWSVRRSPEPLILGDVCCLFDIDSRFKSLGGVQENIQRMYVPISSDCVIVASVTDELPTVDAVELNEASARVSRDYFICKERSPEMNRLQALLGTDSEILTKAEREQIMNEIIDESLGGC
jgi:Protein of unknown function (DUF4238)